DGDRLRTVPAPGHARRGHRPRGCDRDVRARPAHGPVADCAAADSAPEHLDRGDVRMSDALTETVVEEPQDELIFPATLPVLPLKDTVVFPESVTPLAIGQERSIKLVEDVVSGDRVLALVTVKNPEAEQPGWDDLYEVGTAARSEEHTSELQSR